MYYDLKGQQDRNKKFIANFLELGRYNVDEVGFGKYWTKDPNTINKHGDGYYAEGIHAAWISLGFFASEKKSDWDIANKLLASINYNRSDFLAAVASHTLALYSDKLTEENPRYG